MSDISITVGELAFSFSSMGDWANQGQRIWRFHELRGDDAICVDRKGRVCRSGRDFVRAQQDDAYPINVYRLER